MIRRLQQQKTDMSALRSVSFHCVSQKTESICSSLFAALIRLARDLSSRRYPHIDFAAVVLNVAVMVWRVDMS
jgi:hypothetical protein